MKKIQTLNYRGLKHLLLSVLMLFTPLCMWAQTYYDLWIGGVQVTSANASNITGDAILSGSVSFDATSNTLTLVNAVIGDEQSQGIISSKLASLTINLVGKNRITGFIEYKNDDNGTLAFSGTGSLSIGYSDGDMIRDFYTVDFGEYNITTPDPDYSVVYVQLQGSDEKTIRLNNDNNDIVFKVILSKTIYPIWVLNDYDDSLIQAADHNMDDILEDGGTVSFDGNHTITLNGADMNVYEQNYAIYAGASKSDLTVHLLGNNSISYGRVVEFADADNSHLTFSTNESLPGSLQKQMPMLTNSGNAITYNNGLVFDNQNYLIAVPTSNYGISISTDVANFEVTNNNRANVLGDANKSVQFDGNHTLTLNGATLQSITVNSDVFDKDSLIIYLKGDNSIINDANGVANAIIYYGDNRKVNFTTGDGSTTALQPGTLNCTYASGSATAQKLFGDNITVSYSNNLGASLENNTASITAELVPIVNKENKTQINDGNGNGIGNELKVYIQTYLSGKTQEEITNAFGEGITINKILYVLPHNADGFDQNNNGLLDLNSQMSDGNVETVAQKLYDGSITPTSENFKSLFHGLCFLLPAGEGKIVLEVNTSTAGELHVIVGINNPVVIKNKPTFETIEIPYEVQNETYVLIYSTVNPSNLEASRLYASHRAPGRKMTTTTQIRSAGVRASSVSSAPEPPLTPKELKKSDMVAPNIVDGQYATNYKIGQVDDGNVASIADDAFEGLDVTCMDLSETALSGLTVDRDKLPWNKLPYSAYIYLPTGNKVKEGQQNVVIGGVCMNAELLEDNPFEITKDFKAKKIELKRNFTGMDGKKCSIMLPFALDKTTAATLGTFYKMIDGGAGDANDGKVHMQPVTETEANVPYMFMPNIDKIILESIKVEAATSSPEYTIKGMTFKGCFQKTPIESNSSSKYFCFINDQFVCVKDKSVDVKPFRAYMTADASDASFSNTLDIDWGDGTTSIKNMKVGINDNIYYDLQGRRVLYPQKGIYIVNGKKVILK